MLNTRATTLLVALCLLVACGVEETASLPSPTEDLPATADSDTTAGPAGRADEPDAAGTPAPTIAVADDGRPAPPPATDEPSAAGYLGLGRWSCDEVDEMTGGQLRRLGTAEDEVAGCFVGSGTGDDPHAPPPDGLGPWQAGVLYLPPGLPAATVDELGIEQILTAGAILLTVSFGVQEAPIPRDSDREAAGGGYVATEAEGGPAVLRRTVSGPLHALWFVGEPGKRVRVSLMTGRGEQQALSLVGEVERGLPPG